MLTCMCHVAGDGANSFMDAAVIEAEAVPAVTVLLPSLSCLLS